MARDTFVYWKGKSRPTKEEIGLALEDYVRGLAVWVVWDKDRFFATLPGAFSSPFQRVGPASVSQRAMWLEETKEQDGSPRPRWFEVCLGRDNIDVITRGADEVTNNIAHGFAALCARGWGGGLDE